MDIKKIIERDITTAINARKAGKHVIFGFLGMPGIGKTAIIQQVCEEKGLRYFGEMVLSSCSPMDIMGKVPNVEDQVLSSYPNDDIPLDYIVGDEMVLWFIDEVTNATSDTLKAMQQGLLSRQFGKHKLGENVIIVMAGNRQSDKAGSGTLSTAVYNRVTWRNLEWDAASSDAALDYLTGKYANDEPRAMDVRALFQGYFVHKPILEKDFTDALLKIGKDPYVQWCSPRSLEALLCRMSVNGWALPEIVDMAGDIGLGRATELSSFAKLLGKVEKYENVVADPRKAKIPDSVEAQYAMLSNLAVRVDKKNFDKVWEYVARFGEVTMRVVFLKMALKAHPELKSTDSYANLYKTDKSLVQAISAV